MVSAPFFIVVFDKHFGNTAQSCLPRRPIAGIKTYKQIRGIIFIVPYKDNAPDLFVGFNAGYRASWQTALGGIPEMLIEDNNKKWSGDHLVDPALVPGVIFINKKLKLKEPSIVDIASTILDLFDITKPKEIHGKELFKDETK